MPISQATSHFSLPWRSSHLSGVQAQGVFAKFPDINTSLGKVVLDTNFSMLRQNFAAESKYVQ